MEGISRNKKDSQLLNEIMFILVLGLLWSLSEVAIGGALRKVGFHYRGGLLTGIGMGLMGVVFGVYRRPLLIAGATFIAVMGKQLAIPLLHISVLCKANSSIAVMLEGLALSGAVVIMRKVMKKGELGSMAAGGLAALTASAAFYFIGMHVAPCRYLLSFNRPGGLIAFLTVEGVIWAAFSAILFPVGYWLGGQMKEKILSLELHRPAVYYLSSVVLVVGSLIGNALFVIAGF